MFGSRISSTRKSFIYTFCIGVGGLISPFAKLKNNYSRIRLGAIGHEFQESKMSYKNLRGFAVFMAIGLFSANSSAWVVKIDCNEGSDGMNVKQSGALNNFTDAAGATQYTREKYVEGGMACKMRIKEGSSGWGKWGGRKKLPSKVYKGGEVWIRAHTYFPPEFNYDVQSGGRRLKFLRLHTMSDASASSGSCTPANEGYNDWYIQPSDKVFGDQPFSFIKECHDSWRSFGSFKSGESIKKGVWETYEMYLKLDNVPLSKGGGGLVRVWRNDKLLGEFKDIQTLKTAKSYADSFLIFTYWNANSPKTQHMYVDDLVITNQVPDVLDSKGNPRIGTGAVSVSSPPVSPLATLKKR